MNDKESEKLYNIKEITKYSGSVKEYGFNGKPCFVNGFILIIHL